MNQASKREPVVRKVAKPFIVADYLNTEEHIFEYLKAVLEDRDLPLLLRAISDVNQAVLKNFAEAIRDFPQEAIPERIIESPEERENIS